MHPDVLNTCSKLLNNSPRLTSMSRNSSLSASHFAILITDLFIQNCLKDPSLPAAILNHHSITAKVLLDSCCSMILLSHIGDADVKDIVTDLRKRFEKEIEIRNDYLHETWFFGWASESQQDFSDITAFKATSSPAKGLGQKQLATSVAELQRRIDALDELNDAFRRLFGCLIGKFQIKKNFIRYEGRWVSPDTARKRGWSISEP
jgi:hypothetical protein